MVVTYQLALAASAKRVSDVYGGTASIPDETKNIPYRQLIFTAAAADGFLGGTNAVTTGTGLKVAFAAGTVPLSIGPFTTGPVKLSDFYAIGAGSTLTILGVPF